MATPFPLPHPPLCRPRLPCVPAPQSGVGARPTARKTAANPLLRSMKSPWLLLLLVEEEEGWVFSAPLALFPRRP